MKTIAKVCKVSSTGNSIYVQFKRNKYQQGFAFGWCSNPDKLVKGDDVPDFNPKGRVQLLGEDDKEMVHTDGQPVMGWVFE